jgi:hypothetical protein
LKSHHFYIYFKKQDRAKELEDLLINKKISTNKLNSNKSQFSKPNPEEPNGLNAETLGLNLAVELIHCLEEPQLVLKLPRLPRLTKLVTSFILSAVPLLEDWNHCIEPIKSLIASLKEHKDPKDGRELLPILFSTLLSCESENVAHTAPNQSVNSQGFQFSLLSIKVFE